MNRTVWLTIGCSLLSACGGGSVNAGEESGSDDTIDAALWQSGDRLRAVLLDSENGVSQHVGWWDRELEVECRFLEAADGLRCLPAAYDLAESSFTALNGTTWAYLDPDCTQRVLVVGDECADVPELVTLWDGSSSCPSVYEVFRTMELDASAQLFNPVPGFSECAASPYSGSSLYLVESEDPSLFAGATQEDHAFDDELGVRRLASVDGAWEARSLVADGNSCALDSRQREGPCLPLDRGLVVSGVHLDSNCADEPRDMAQAICPLAGDGVVVDVLEPEVCSSDLEVFSAGAEFTGGVYRPSAGFPCSKAPSGVYYHELGPTLDQESFARVARMGASEGVSGRWVGTADIGLVQDYSSWFWHVDGVGAHPVREADTYRLGPTENLGRDYLLAPYRYSDSECTEPLYPMLDSPLVDACGNAAEFLLVVDGEGCGQSRYHRPKAYLGPVYLVASVEGAPTCVLEGEAPDDEYSTPGAPVTDELPVLTKRVE